MEVVVSSEIPRLKKMKGESRIWTLNPISEIILGIEFEDYPGIGHEFLESRPYTSDKGSWIEHLWLLRGSRTVELHRILRSLEKLLRDVEMFKTWGKEVDYCTLEEIDSTEPSHYYFLISILSNGKDNFEEKEECFSVEEYNHLLPSYNSR